MITAYVGCFISFPLASKCFPFKQPPWVAPLPRILSAPLPLRCRISRDDRSLPGWIVFPQYKAGAVTTLERVPKAHALMELAGHSFNYNYVPTGYEALVELVRRTECWTLQYSDLDDVIDKLILLTDT